MAQGGAVCFGEGQSAPSLQAHASSSNIHALSLLPGSSGFLSHGRRPLNSHMGMYLYIWLFPLGGR